MTTSVSMERLFERVHLTRGKGSRRENRLCLMTFVALLAGERHTDSPKTASTFVRHFAIRLNDFMSDDRRQQLKIFAPRIVGTNDDCDNQRIELARVTFAQEIIPRLDADHGRRWLSHQTWGRITSFAERPFACAKLFAWPLIERMRVPDRDLVCVSREAANLLIHCAQSAPADVDTEWYWGKAVELLDRLCDVGGSPVLRPVDDDTFVRAERALDKPMIGEAAFAAIGEHWRNLATRITGRQPEMHHVPGRHHHNAFELEVRPTSGPGQWDEVWTVSPKPASSSFAAQVQAMAFLPHKTP